MEGGSNLEAVPEDDLVVIPRPQNAQAPSNKRTFQKRRRSRACDACRLRKTKCDAPPEGICTSCASASLLCKFSESEHEKKKIGPARRLRMLETTVQELNEKLKIAEAKLQSGERGSDGGGLDVESSPADSHSLSMRRKSESPSTSTTTGHSPNDLSPRPSLSLPLRSFSYDNSPNEDVFVGSTSGLGFLTSVKDYVERLGYDTTPLLNAWKDSEAKTYATNPSPYPEGSQIRDLRALLPPQEDGKKLLDIFYRNTPSRRGWHYLECARKFHDLNQPMYSLADAEVFMVMAMYLDLAALPSPSWMTAGSLVRVCQDLGLHRKPADGKFTPAEREHRSRLFWAAFLLDRKLALQFGRPPILDEEEIDMDEPGTNETNDLVDTFYEAGPSGSNVFVGVVLMQKLIAASRFIDPILRFSVEAGNEEQVEYRMSDIEQKLDSIEKSFPEGILDWDNSSPLDPVLVKYSMLPMAIRLSMYRYFTDATLDRRLRTRCFIRSVEVGKSTAHLLSRMMRHPDWERGFRLHQSELSYQHTFKISIVLLLASTIFTKPFQVTTNGELETCIKALHAAALARPTAVQCLNLFNEIAKILKNEQTPGSYNPTIETPAGMPYHNLDYSVTPSASSYASLAASSIPSNPSASSSSISPSPLPGGPKQLYVPPVVPSNDIRVDNSIVPKFWPNYESSGRAALGFSSLKDPSPNESSAWLSQVDPSYWALMENILSNEANLNEKR
ncbi:ABC-transporter-regulating transcription factor [Drechslerella dactyloides]|uniref:ABC-transporter-regulating transcription factor n=1 Tax=Drechslerella dactyloides TaxID=74499 RepID=A0AAD6NGE0_DREDA|nr:ABC-transporter-regulating transcription factor [Drechslerella dactyloides]